MAREKFEQWRQDGVTAEEARDYAEWLTCRNTTELPLKKVMWIPTPLPVVYIGEKGQIIRLPFLDCNRKSRVFGVAVGKVCYRAKLMLMDVYRFGLIDVVSWLNDLRDEIYPPKKNLVSKVLCSESIYARDFIIPDLNAMQQAYIQRFAFDRTLQILQENGIQADLWGEDDFISCYGSEHPVVDFGTGMVKTYASPEESGKLIHARPAVIIKEYDPPYPVTNGVFDWEIWKELEF